MRFLYSLAVLPSAIVLAGVRLLAFGLRPFALGRLLTTVSLPRLSEHRLRTTFTVLGVALGVAVLVAVVMVSRSIVKSVTGTVGDLAGTADLQISASSSGFDEVVLDQIGQVVGITHQTPVMQQTATLRNQTGERERLLIMGVDLLGNEDSHFRSYKSQELDEIRRDPLAFLNSPHNLILGRDLGRRLGIKVHDTVSISTASGFQSFEVWGFVEDSGVGRAFGGAVAVMYYPAMQVAFGRGRNIDRIDLALGEDVPSSEVAEALHAALGSGFRVEPPASRGERVAQMLIAVRTALSMASVLALMAGAFLVVSTMGISVVQRRRELGILRALGASRRRLVALLTLEGALLGAVGSALGVGLALLISRSALNLTSDAVNEVYLEQAASDVQLDGGVIALGFLLGVVAATIAAFIATRRAGGVKPAEALSAGGAPAGPLARPGKREDLGAGLLLLATLLLLRIPPVDGMPYGAIAASLTLMLAARLLMPRVVLLVHHGVTLLRAGRLRAETLIATDNLPRDLSRTSSMASGLMAGVGLSVTVGTFVVSFITSLNTWSAQLVPGDLIVASGTPTVGLSGRNTPMEDSMRETLLAVPGVKRVRSTLFTEVEYRGLPVKMKAVDQPRLSRQTALEGSEADIFDGLARGELAVSENFSRLFGVHRGDELKLGTKRGTHAFKVAGVVVDYTSDRGVIIAQRETHLAHWGDSRADSYELFLDEATDPERVRATINETLADKHDLFVLTTREFRGEFVKASNKIFGLMHVLEVVTLAVAILGLISALLANVIDRVREIGVLRAIGMLRAQLRSMITIEATLVGLVGVIGGISVGLGIGFILLRYVLGVQTGWHLPYHFPLSSTLTMLTVTLPISALAGFYPALRAGRFSVRDALDYE